MRTCEYRGPQSPEEGVGLLAAGVTGNRGTPSVGTGTRTTIPTNRKLATPLITFGKCFEVTFFSMLARNSDPV